MPTYDYLCRTCGQRFEIFHKMAEQAPKSGPNCTGKGCDLEKQLTAPAITVKSPNPLTSYGSRLNVDQNAQTKQDCTPEQAHACGTGCAFHKH